MNIDQVAQAMTAQIYESFKAAIAIGKWRDGSNLSEEQREICMQAIIAYEYKNLPEEERVGYLPQKASPCAKKVENNDNCTVINSSSLFDQKTPLDLITKANKK